MFEKILVNRDVLFDLFCKELSHIKSYHTGDLYRNVHHFNEIYEGASYFVKNDTKKYYSTRCDGLIYEYECLIHQMERYPKILETLIGSSKEEIKKLNDLKEEIFKL